MRRLAILAALLLPAGAAGAVEEIDGLWDRSAAACAEALSETRLSVTPGAVVFWESRCEVRARERGADGAWEVVAACEGEGERWETRLTLRALGADRLRLSRDGGEEIDYVRCG